MDKRKIFRILAVTLLSPVAVAIVWFSSVAYGRTEGGWQLGFTWPIQSGWGFVGFFILAISLMLIWPTFRR